MRDWNSAMRRASSARATASARARDSFSANQTETPVAIESVATIAAPAATCPRFLRA
jgi:hypothetical protein